MHSSLLQMQGIAFLTVLAAGLCFLLIGAVFGAFSGGHADHDGGHDHSHGDLSPDHDFPTISIFSPRIIAIFAVGLGAGGAIATIYGATGERALLIGLLSGFSPAALAVVGMRALYRQQATTEVRTSSAVGKVGTIANEVIPNGSGEVSLYVDGQYMTYVCRGQPGKTYPRGAAVKVTAVAGNALIVDSVN